MADIFISYSRRDSEQALSLAERLRASGATVWMDTAALAAAETWSAEIVNAIEKCTHFFLLLSDDSVASLNVTKEVSLASEAKKTIVPIEIHHCELNAAMKYALAGLQKVSLSDEIALTRAFEKLGISSTDFQSVQTAPERTEVRPTTLRIAVLPFEDLSPAGDHDWFSDGLTYELISKLSKIQQLNCLDRQSVKEFKKSELRTKEIAQILSVKYIVIGGVRKAGNNIQINASLIDAISEETLWDDKFPGSMDAIFEIQEQIAENIIEGLKCILTPEEKSELTEFGTTNAEAFEFLLLGHNYTNKNTKQDILHSITFYEKAIQLDDQFLRAYTSLATSLMFYYRYYNKTNELLVHIEDVITKARNINPLSALVYMVRGEFEMLKGNSEASLQALQKSIELDPNSFLSRYTLARLYTHIGSPSDAIHEFEEALRIMPNQFSIYFSLAITYNGIDMLDKAEETALVGIPHFEKYISRHPDDILHQLNYAILLSIAGKKQDSIKTAEAISSIENIDALLRSNLAFLFLMLHEYQRAAEIFEQAIDQGFAKYSLKELLEETKFNPLHEYEPWKRIVIKLQEKERVIENG